MGKMEDNFIDLIVTSPPYFNAREYSQYNNLNHYLSEMKDIFSGCFRVLKPSRMIAVNVSCVIQKRKKRSEQSFRIPLPFKFANLMEEIGFEFLEDIIWEKPDGAAKNRNAKFFQIRKPVSYKPNIVTEYILIFKKPAPFLIDKVLQNHSLVEDGYERTNVWKFNPKTKSKHSAPFPIELPERCIKYYSYENELIYDPFMGEGTTAQAAELLNRKWIGSEFKKYHCQLIEQNLKKVREKLLTRSTGIN